MLSSSWFCPHTETTPADATGRAVCVKCGSCVRVQLTPDALALQLDQILYGVSFEDAWGRRIDPKDVHAGPAE